MWQGVGSKNMRNWKDCNKEVVWGRFWCSKRNEEEIEIFSNRLGVNEFIDNSFKFYAKNKRTYNSVSQI